MKYASATVLAGLVTVLSGAGRAETGSPGAVNLDVTHWQVVKRDSGPVNYYQVVNDPVLPFVHAHYAPPLATTVLGFQVADNDRKRATSVAWQWRAVTLPRGGDECADGRTDSAAVVYLTWKRTFRYFTLKYVWSAVGRRGAVCDRKRNLFVAQDTIILESGPPLGAWRSEEVDLKVEFRKHFDDGDPAGDVPDFVGVGIMSDGDQTKSESEADYAGFVLKR